MTESSEDNLPDGWAIARLEEIVSKDGVFGDGDWVESKDQDPNGAVRLVQLADIGEMRFLDKSRRYMTDAKADELNCTFLLRGDLLISRLGDPLGKTCVYPANEDKAVTAVDVCILRPAHDDIESRLFGYFLNGVNLHQTIDAQSSGTTRKRITGKKLKALSVPIPPTNEQRRIVEKIDTLFARLDKGEEAVREVQMLLTRYRQSVLKSAVTGQLTADWRAERAGQLEHGRDLLARILQTRRDNWQGRGKYKEPAEPDSTNLPELPAGWAWSTLEQLGFVLSGQTPKGVDAHVVEGGNIPWFKVSSMTDPGNEDFLLTSRWMFTEESARTAKLNLLPAGTIAFPKRGGAILTNKKRRLGIPGALDLNTMGYLPVALADYVWAYFQGLDLRQIYDGSNVPQINYHDVADQFIAVPSEEEAQVISDEVRDRLSQISKLEAWCETELKRSASLRQSILKDAFAGRLVPQDPADEAARDLLARIAAERTSTKMTRQKVSA